MGTCNSIKSSNKTIYTNKVETKESQYKSTKSTRSNNSIIKDRKQNNKNIDICVISKTNTENNKLNNENNSKDKLKEKVKKSIENSSISVSVKCMSFEYKNAKKITKNDVFKTVDNKKESKNNSNNNIINCSLWRDIKMDYIFGKNTIGEGSFAEVRIAKKKNDPLNNFFAVKSIFKPSVDPETYPYLINEIKLLVSLSHPNIIKFIESYQDEYYLHLVMEYCSGGELFNKILKKKKLSEEAISKIIWNLLSAIAYCHSKGIVHRDIKPENILLENNDKVSKNEDDYSGLKLIDFGLSKKFDNHEKLKSVLGTNYYIAPEVLEENYDAKSDIWSIGVITYFLISRKLPFYDSMNNNNIIFEKIKTKEPCFKNKTIWGDISNEAINFIKLCLIKNPDKRPSANQALTNAWFLNIRKQKKANSKKDLCSKSLSNLKAFRHSDKLKKLILKAIMNNFISCAELTKLRKIFQTINVNQSGYIDVHELAQAFKKCSIELSKSDFKRISENCNEKNGKIDYSAFLIMSLDPSLYLGKDILEKVFNYFDVDKSNWVDAQDIVNVLVRFGENTGNVNEIEASIKNIAGGKTKMFLKDFIKLFS